jgi:hypothetical protein
VFEVRPQTQTPAGKQLAVVLSDVHIGDNSPTCWYQAAVHERPLSHALDWILRQRSIIREVVLLGDMFDVWTYPPSVRPPSMREIIAANRQLLGPDGPLAAVVRALPGQVRLLLGNHDGSLTRADIDLLNRSLGGDPARRERIELVTDRYRVVAGISGARTVFSHGHHWCMANAPDARSRWATIPIGHFVSRAIAYQLLNGPNRLRPGETAAHRQNSGNPSGIAPEELRSAFLKHRDDFAAFLVTYFCQLTGMPMTERVVMPDGTTTTAQEAARVFSGLFSLWVGREGRAPDAARAALADVKHEHLAWFAQRLAMRTGSDLAVMGHTHTAVGGLSVSPVGYVNSGYMCVARPDGPRSKITFTLVDLERASARVMAVVGTPGGLRVHPARAPFMRSAIIRPALDYSCYARIENRSDRALRLVSARTNSASFWVVPPPTQIPPHGRAHIWLSDRLGLRGSAGGFTYSHGAKSLEFALACPFRIAPNDVRSPVPNFETRIGNQPWRPGGVDRTGHPVQARFYVGARVPAGAGPTSTDATRANGRTRAPSRPGARSSAPPRSGVRPGARSGESRFVVAARAILDRAATPRERGVVLCQAHLSSNDGTPLINSANPPAHLLSRRVETITVDGTEYRYFWIQPNVPPTPVSPPNSGGVAFLPEPGSPVSTLVTFNFAGLDGDFRRGCINGHHAEMQVVCFINAQPIGWRMNLGKLELHNRSRRGLSWGYSACNACLSDLSAFLVALNSITRPAPVGASISWERLYTKNPRCGHPTDAANIRRLVAAGWDEPIGPRPAGTRRPTVVREAPGRPRMFTA